VTDGGAGVTSEAPVRARDIDAPVLLDRLTREVAASRAALAALDGADRDAAVHAVRKRLKLVRTIVRLLATSLGGPGAALKVELREAARALAGARDASVLAATARTLAGKMKRPRDRARLEALAERVVAAHSARPDAATADARLAAAMALLESAALAPFAQLSLRLAAARTYRRARKAMRHARASDHPEALHDWRKRVKDRLHLARLYARAWPEPFPPRAGKLDRLGELLGRDHDLDVLRAALGDGRGLRRIDGEISRRRHRLQRKAFALGARLFAAKPAVVREAWAAGQGRMR
jgi:CHAD domain-containing protein